MRTIVLPEHTRLRIFYKDENVWFSLKDIVSIFKPTTQLVFPINQCDINYYNYTKKLKIINSNGLASILNICKERDHDIDNCVICNIFNEELLTNVKWESKPLIYIISNPDFRHSYKIGITNDLNKRLSVYQTHAPKRYNVIYYRYTENNAKIEMNIKKFLEKDKIQGEWFNSLNISKIIHKIDYLCDKIDK